VSSIRVQNLTKRYGRVLGVNDISFEVAQGEFLAILGPSGCGKTSTMRVIAGLETPDAGQIWLGDRVVNDLSPAERNVAMVFENYGLYPHWTVFQNIAYPLHLRGMPAVQIRGMVEKMARLVDVHALLSRKPDAIAGGARQRVGLARALVRNPEVFLLDEPMSHVDPDFRSQLRVELKRIQRETGGTFIYVTHDQLEAMSMADRIIVMRDGTIQQIGLPQAIFDRPANEFVGSFLGEPPMNFLPARITASRAGPTLVLPNAGQIALPERWRQAPGLTLGTECKLGIRPHRVSITPAASAEGVVAGRVHVVEPLGDVTIVTIKVADSVIKVEAPPPFEFRPDETVRLGFSASDILLFDGATGTLLMNGTDG
jgi:multiple sugar transport system ATP-binding protein